MSTLQAGRIRLAIPILAAAALLAACSSSGPGASGGSAPAGTSPAGTSTGTSAGTSTASSAGTSTASSPSTSTSVAAGGGSASVDVCGLLSSAQASSINKVTYGAATAKHITAGWDQCQYANTGKHADPVDIQALEVDVITIPNCWADLHQSDGGGTPVSGIGDEAFGYQIGLAVKLGSRCIQVQGLTHNELNGDYSHDVALARIIVGHLH